MGVALCFRGGYPIAMPGDQADLPGLYSESVILTVFALFRTFATRNCEYHFGYDRVCTTTLTNFTTFPKISQLSHNFRMFSVPPMTAPTPWPRAMVLLLLLMLTPSLARHTRAAYGSQNVLQLLRDLRPIRPPHCSRADFTDAGVSMRKFAPLLCPIHSHELSAANACEISGRIGQRNAQKT